MEPIEAVAEMIVNANRIVVFTGAGFSTESGVPDFRSPGGVWDTFDPGMLNYQNFLASEEVREEYWRMHRMMWETIREAKPNAGHAAVAELHAIDRLDAVVTQNTDGLHQAAGVPAELVIELHGTMKWVDCLDCGRRYPRPVVHDMLVAGTDVPRCECGGLLKPATVAFGQGLPERELQEAAARSGACDVFLAAGSSLLVYPAAQLPLLAKQHGATLIILNLTDTPHDRYADIIIREKTGATLSRVMERLRDRLAG
jgi:NAD-dependent deacetylase